MHPYLLHSGHLYLPTFGVLAAVGLMLALALSERTARVLGLPAEKVWDAGIFAVVAAFVLSRLLLVVAHFASFRAFPLLLLAVPSLTPAGLLLTAVASAGWLRAHHLPVLCVLDAWAPCATLVWASLALGHFFEGSDPGLPPSLPVALYAAFAALFLTGGLLLLLSRYPARAGSLAGGALAGAGTTQFLLTFLRQPGAPGPLGLEQLEYVALGMIVAGAVLLWQPFQKPR